MPAATAYGTTSAWRAAAASSPRSARCHGWSAVDHARGPISTCTSVSIGTRCQLASSVRTCDLWVTSTPLKSTTTLSNADDLDAMLHASIRKSPPIVYIARMVGVDGRSSALGQSCQHGAGERADGALPSGGTRRDPL